jgi:predicted ABC-type transport system involved in lysophospholipase L1 biosynthesis ATPase subunit
MMFRHVEAAGAALVIATHDTSVAERMPQRWTITERKLQTGAPCTF